MRVCFLNNHYCRSSGVTTMIRRLTACASFADIELFVAGGSSLEQRKRIAKEEDIVAPDHYASFELMSSGVALVPELYRFVKWLRASQCELVHVHHRRLAVLANLLRGISGVPVLFTGHLTFAETLWFKALAPRWATGVSPSVVRYIERCTRAKDVSLIYNPLLFRDGTLSPQTRSTTKVISIGRLDPVKGHAMLIEAWSLLKRTGVRAHLDIFGEGSLRASLEALIRARGMESEVRLCGFAPDLQDRLDEYAFNVLSSETEGFPNVVIEAASHGMPTLVTNVEGSRDTLPPTLVLPNGLPFGDVEQLSSTLQQWLGSPELVLGDGARFHEFLKPLCCPDAVGKAYRKLYESILHIG